MNQNNTVGRGRSIVRNRDNGGAPNDTRFGEHAKDEPAGLGTVTLPEPGQPDVIMASRSSYGQSDEESKTLVHGGDQYVMAYRPWNYALVDLDSGLTRISYIHSDGRNYRIVHEEHDGAGLVGIQAYRFDGDPHDVGTELEDARYEWMMGRRPAGSESEDLYAHPPGRYADDTLPDPDEPDRDAPDFIPSQGDPALDAGVLFDRVETDGTLWHRRRDGVYPAEPYGMRFQSETPLTDTDIERMSQAIGYSYSSTVRGESMPTAHRDSACSFIVSADTTKSRSDDLGMALERFEDDFNDTVRDGSPERKTDRAGAGTKGTRLVDGLGADAPTLHIFYDDVHEV